MAASEYREAAKRTYSRIGLGLLVSMALHFVLELAFDLIISRQGLVLKPWLEFLVNSVVFNYLCAFIGYQVYRGLPAFPIERRSIPIRQFIKLPFITLFLQFLGRLLFLALLAGVAVLISIASGNGQEAAAEAANGSDAFQEIPLILSFLFTVVLGPIVEEIICRKTIIDRTRIYGEKIAVISSAIMFGIYHTNFQQLFHTAFMGLAFAYVYTKTGNLSYSIILHIINNFLAFVYGNLRFSEMLPSLSSGELTGTDRLKLAFLPIFGILIICGLVFFLRERKQIRFETQERDLQGSGGFWTVWLTVGMVLFTIGGLILGMG